uniref:Uncharacterized protein n=1 Tax=Romanomermis culicivorax TaxID=13658 RepID=A0A915L6S2_ROMCU
MVGIIRGPGKTASSTFGVPFKQFVIGTNDNLLAIDVVMVHPKTIGNGEAFAFRCTVLHLCVCEHMAVIEDNPLVVAIFL